MAADPMPTAAPILAALLLLVPVCGVADAEGALPAAFCSSLGAGVCFSAMAAFMTDPRRQEKTRGSIPRIREHEPMA